MAALLIPITFLGLMLWWLIDEKNRRKGLLALAEKYNLEINPSRPIAPDLDIHGWIFPATYKRYMQGRIRGVAVVAFDYNIGFGRGKQSGSCVGVQRNVRDAATISRKLTPARVDGLDVPLLVAFISQQPSPRRQRHRAPLGPVASRSSRRHGTSFIRRGCARRHRDPACEDAARVRFCNERLRTETLGNRHARSTKSAL